MGDQDLDVQKVKKIANRGYNNEETAIRCDWQVYDLLAVRAQHT
jgi:hypothetical protein